MPYERKVERAHPGLIVMILDDSGSMVGSLPGTSDTRFQWVERYSGIILKELLARCMEVPGGTPTVRARYYLDVIKYGSSVETWQAGAEGDEELDIGEATKRFTDNGSLGLGGKLGGTDTAAAFQFALQRIEKAIQKERFKDSFPPIVFHLTDGESHTDAEPIARQVTSLSSSDGNVLLVNAYIGTSTQLNYKDPNDFPGYLDEQEVGPSEDNLRLFRMSSVIPETMRQNLVNDGIFPAIRENARLFFDVRTKEMLKHVIQVVGSGGSRLAR
ncbi:MAG: vWA domain-containing protein [Pyrinomonadaceae bacterium]